MKQKGTIKLIIAALSLVGIGAGAFSLATDVFADEELNKVQKVTTNYQVEESFAPVGMMQEIEITPGRTYSSEEVKDGNIVFTFKECNVYKDELTTYKDTPTSVDLNMEDAMERGMGCLAYVFDDVDFTDSNVYMSYIAGTPTFPRAVWYGDVLFSTERKPESTRWGFMIDAVTGELLNAYFHEDLTVDVPLGLDEALMENYGEYADIAKSFAEKCSFINGNISKVNYLGQGYSGNNPVITLEAVCDDGSSATMTFSRYNKKLMALSTDTYNKVRDAALDNLSEESAEMESVVIENAGE